MLRYVITAFATLLLSDSPATGVRVEFAMHFTSVTPARQEMRSQYNRTVEIDGGRFRIIGPNLPVETSLDDGATTFFGDDRASIQTPLKRDSAPGRLAGVTSSVEDERLSIGPPHPGPVIAGIPTREYAVDYSYVLVLTAPTYGTTTRLPSRHHYSFFVGDIASPAAFRVMLSRGFGAPLAHYSEAFRGFPLRMDAQLVEGDTAAPSLTTDFHVSVVSVAPWSWPPND